MIRTVGSEIDRLEGELREKVPGLVYVDLETDKGAEKRRELGSAEWPSDVDIAAMRRQYEGAASAAAAAAAAGGKGGSGGSGAGGVAPPAAA